MNNLQQVELYKLFLDSNMKHEQAEKIDKILADDTQQVETLKKVFLTKDDKVDLITRMDTYFKWLAGIVIAAIGLAVAILKM
jgi:hypothetical protein